MKKRCLLFELPVLLLCLWGLSAPAWSAYLPDTTGMSKQRKHSASLALIEASRLKLAKHPGWLALLHYKTETLSRQIVSQADDDAFFLAADGRTNAAAEMHMDLLAFFQIAPRSKYHAQCLFPARWYWLKQQLGLNDDFDVPCYQLDVFLESYGSDALTLVFPAMYLNNPGSTFGHTFLRFDDANTSILFSKTLNYAAKVDKTDSLPSYIVNGLFGGYPGIFKTRKYYRTVQEYSNLENRDIWEYQLDFSPQEIQQLARHVWEVKGIDFDYYFFRENCAYRLLALLDAVRPELNLTTGNQFMLYAIPVDTVRALDSASLISKRTFRPSLATQLKQFYSHGGQTADELPLDERGIEKQTSKKTDLSSMVTALANEEIKVQTVLASALSLNDKAIVLEQAYTLLQFRQISDEDLGQQILSARSKLLPVAETSSATLLNKTLADESESLLKEKAPESGHQSRRFAIGFGQQLDQSYIDLRFRPAFHDLIDAPQGYVNGADINVLDTRLKFFTETNALRLESLRLFNITSLSPVSGWYQPMSWFLDIRIDRTSLMAETNTAANSDNITSVQNFLTRGGGGYSFKYKALTPFLLATTEINLAKQYEKGYFLYLGAKAGSLFNTRLGQGLVSVQRDAAIAGANLDRTLYKAQWQFNVTNDTALRLGYQKIRYESFDDNDWFVNVNVYF